jgi:hypothetical protein
MAIREEILDSKAHGLIFRKDDQILACAAEITAGTFFQYLKIEGLSPKRGAQISLNDCCLASSRSVLIISLQLAILLM